MAGTSKFPVIGGRRMRVTLNDSCGTPAWGDSVYAVPGDALGNGFVSVHPTPNYDDGNAISIPDANGDIQVSRAGKSKLLDIALDIVFTKVDAAVYSAITGAIPYLDRQTGVIKGFTKRRGIDLTAIRWGLEVWSDAFDEGCTVDGLVPFVYFLWPNITGGKFSDYTIENNAVSFGITGARSKDGSGWADGPYLVDTDASGDPATLANPLGVYDHEVMFQTVIEPPDSTNGFLPLDDPSQPDATGAAAGSPGHFTPTGDVRPANLAGMAGITASPSSAWTTGQYVVLGDGSKAHYNGTAWVVGSA